MRPSKLVDHIPEIAQHLSAVCEVDPNEIKNLRLEEYSMSISPHQKGRPQTASIDVIDGKPLAPSSILGDFESLQKLQESRHAIMLESDIESLTGLARNVSLGALVRYSERDLSTVRGKRKRKLGRAVSRFTDLATDMSLTGTQLTYGITMPHKPEEYVPEHKEHYCALLPFVSRGLRRHIKKYLRPINEF